MADDDDSDRRRWTAASVAAASAAAFAAIATVAAGLSFFSGNSAVSFINNLAYLEIGTTSQLASGQTAAKLTLWGFCTVAANGTTCNVSSFTTLASAPVFVNLPTPPALTENPLQPSTVAANLPSRTSTVGFLGTLIGAVLLFACVVTALLGATWRGRRAVRVLAVTASVVAVVGLGAVASAFGFLLTAALQLHSQIATAYAAQGISATLTVNLLVPLALAILFGLTAVVLAVLFAVFQRGAASGVDGTDADGYAAPAGAATGVADTPATRGRPARGYYGGENDVYGVKTQFAPSDYTKRASAAPAVLPRQSIDLDDPGASTTSRDPPTFATRAPSALAAYPPTAGARPPSSTDVSSAAPLLASTVSYAGQSSVATSYAAAAGPSAIGQPMSSVSVYPPGGASVYAPAAAGGLAYNAPAVSPFPSAAAAAYTAQYGAMGGYGYAPQDPYGFQQQQQMQQQQQQQDPYGAGGGSRTYSYGF